MRCVLPAAGFFAAFSQLFVAGWLAHLPLERRSRFAPAFPHGGCGQLFQIGQLLFQREHGFEQIAHLLEALDDLGASNTSRLASFFLSARSTSSQVTGVETVGCSRARSEYTATVVLCSSFWLQSTKTLPVRMLLHLRNNLLADGRVPAVAQARAQGLGHVVGGRSVQRDVDLQALRSGGLGKTLRDPNARRSRAATDRPGSIARCSREGRGRDRRPSWWDR